MCIRDSAEIFTAEAAAEPTARTSKTAVGSCLFGGAAAALFTGTGRPRENTHAVSSPAASWHSSKNRDVYKRQVVLLVFVGVDVDKFRAHLGIKDGLAAVKPAVPGEQIADGTGHRKIPVSYTHLDVYKRQMYVTGIANIRDVLPFPRTTGFAEF